MIRYGHVTPQDHKVKLAPASPNTDRRYCDICNREVVRLLHGKPRG